VWQAGVGFTAIIVSWLAKLNPVIILIVTMFFSILEKGSSVMQSTYGLSQSVSSILQGIILFIVLGMDFFTRYRIVFRRQGKKMIINFLFASIKAGTPLLFVLQVRL
jgi:simple sugar transport system permease protein